jgi:hypothetical protein
MVHWPNKPNFGGTAHASGQLCGTKPIRGAIRATSPRCPASGNKANSVASGCRNRSYGKLVGQTVSKERTRFALVTCAKQTQFPAVPGWDEAGGTAGRGVLCTNKASFRRSRRGRGFPPPPPRPAGLWPFPSLSCKTNPIWDDWPADETPIIPLFYHSSIPIFAVHPSQQWGCRRIDGVKLGSILSGNSIGQVQVERS